MMVSCAYKNKNTDQNCNGCLHKGSHFVKGRDTCVSSECPDVKDNLGLTVHCEIISTGIDPKSIMHSVFKGMK